MKIRLFPIRSFPRLTVKLLGFCAAAAAMAIAATATAAVTDISGTINVDTEVGAGNSGRLVGTTATLFYSGGFAVPVDLNGNILNIDSGGGSGGDQYMTVTGAISGAGTLHVKGWGTKGIHLGGSTANTILAPPSWSNTPPFISKKPRATRSAVPSP